MVMKKTEDRRQETEKRKTQCNSVKNFVKLCAIAL